MAKLNLKELLGAVKGTPGEGAKLEKAGQLIKDAGLATDDDSLVKGTFSEEKANEIVAEIENLIKGFKDTKKFDFKVHVSKPVQTVGTVLRALEVTEENRDQAEEVISDLIKDLYLVHNPDIPWVPEPVETWVENIILKNAVPALVDMVFDLLFSEDEK